MLYMFVSRIQSQIVTSVVIVLCLSFGNLILILVNVKNEGEFQLVSYWKAEWNSFNRVIKYIYTNPLGHRFMN